MRICSGSTLSTLEHVCWCPAGFFFAVRRTIDQWAYNKDNLFNPKFRIIKQVYMPDIARPLNSLPACYHECIAET